MFICTYCSISEEDEFTWKISLVPCETGYSQHGSLGLYLAVRGAVWQKHSNRSHLMMETYFQVKARLLKRLRWTQHAPTGTRESLMTLAGCLFFPFAHPTTSVCSLTGNRMLKRAEMNEKLVPVHLKLQDNFPKAVCDRWNDLSHLSPLFLYRVCEHVIVYT